jgi:hypothetical protein
MDNRDEALRYITNINKAGINPVLAVVSRQRVSDPVKIRRDIEILRQLARGSGYSALVQTYGISRQRIHQIAKRYSGIAEKILSERKRENEQQ